MRASTYDELGEFHDLFMTGAWDELRPLVAATFGDLGRNAVVVEVGAGSGLGTRVLAEECDAQLVRPGAEPADAVGADRSGGR